MIFAGQVMTYAVRVVASSGSSTRGSAHPTKLARLRKVAGTGHLVDHRRSPGSDAGDQPQLDAAALPGYYILVFR